MIGSRIAKFEILVCWLVIFGIPSGVTWGQTDTLDVAGILEYLSEGNAGALVSHAEDYLELALLEQPRRYTRSQALYVLEKFFRQYSPDGFRLDHSMTQGEEWWLTGSYSVRDERQGLRFYLRFGGIFPEYRLMAIQVIRS